MSRKALGALIASSSTGLSLLSIVLGLIGYRGTAVILTGMAGTTLLVGIAVILRERRRERTVDALRDAVFDHPAPVLVVATNFQVAQMWAHERGMGPRPSAATGWIYVQRLSDVLGRSRECPYVVVSIPGTTVERAAEMHKTINYLAGAGHTEYGTEKW